MKIQLIRNEACPNWQKAEELLKEALVETQLTQDHEVVVVKNDKEAESYQFFGSPQIIIDGKDIDPLAAKASDFHFQGCRFYLWEAEGPEGTRRRKVLEHPPKEMILQALGQAK